MPLTIFDDALLWPLTTLELGGRARHLAVAGDEAAVAEALRWAGDRRLPVLVLGGGSNVVIGEAGWDGLVVRITSRGVAFEAVGGEMRVTAQAGEPWDALVEGMVARGLAGLECLSGIPGLAGATPIQNVGAYGQEVADTIRAVRVLERGSGRVLELPPEACGFAYRDSAFKRDPERHLVLAVTFGLRPGGAPTLRYQELADAVARGGGAPTLAGTRAAVLALRRAKSMVIDPEDPNRRSVGSFFTNPVLPAARAAEVAARAAAAGAAGPMPQWPAGPGLVKLSAGWLIERAGIAKGFRRGAVGVSSRHALALVHHGGGTAAELLALAREIRDAVRAKFAVSLVPEPVLVGARWDT